MSYPSTSWNGTGTASTAWTDAEGGDTPAAGCGMKVSETGVNGQNWTIKEVNEWICRLGIPIRDMGPGTSFSQTP